MMKFRANLISWLALFFGIQALSRAGWVIFFSSNTDPSLNFNRIWITWLSPTTRGNKACIMRAEDSSSFSFGNVKILQRAADWIRSRVPGRKCATSPTGLAVKLLTRLDAALQCEQSLKIECCYFSFPKGVICTRRTLNLIRSLPFSIYYKLGLCNNVICGDLFLYLHVLLLLWYIVNILIYLESVTSIDLPKVFMVICIWISMFIEF